MRRVLLSSLALLLVGLADLRAADPPVEAPEPISQAQEATKPGEPANPPTEDPADAESEKAGRHVHYVDWNGRREGMVVFGRDVTVTEEQVAGDVIVLAGNAIIRGRVRDLVVISGNATISGEVEGDLVAVLGSATLEPGASVRRDATVVGGQLTTREGALIGGKRVEFSLANRLLNLPKLHAWLRHGFLLGRPLPPQVEWAWWVAGAVLMLYLLLAVLFPKSLAQCVEVLELRPAASFFTGLLILMLGAPLIILLAISVIGILAIPFLLCGLIFAFLFGKVAVYRFTGQQLARQLHLSVLQLSIPAFLIGAGVFCFFYTVPVVGFLLWGIATVLGLGAVSLVFFRALAPAARPRSTRAVVPVAPGPNPPSSPGTPATGMDPMPASQTEVSLATPPEVLPRAGFWIRLAATLLDALMIGALMLPFHLTGLTLLVWVAYHIGMWTWKGTTVGGIILGIKCVRTNGDRLSFPVALVRSLASFLSALALFLGFLWTAWDREKQSWHDKIAGTIKVRVPRGISLV